MRKLVVFTVKVLLLLFVHVPIAASFSFTKKPADPTVVVEGVNSTRVQLVWNFTGASSFFIIVRVTDESQTTAIAGRTHISNFTVFNSDYEVDLPLTLVIKNATRNDHGDAFRVGITNTDTVREIVDVVTLNVLYTPEFTNVSDDKTVTEGGAGIILLCMAIGEPPPNIAWTRVLDNGSDSSVLFTGEQFDLGNNRSSSGTYRCTASNGIGTAPNRTIVVDVNYKPENVMLTVNDSNICEGEIINITCSADGKPSVHTYQLFEDDIPVPDSGTAGVWKITMSAQGNFTHRCVANNTIGTTDKNVTVTVNVPAVVYPLENITVTEGENRTLTCNVSGSPTLSVTWTEVKTGISTMGITRELTDINRDESGEYKCEASNSRGNDTASTFLIVQYKPENFQFAASEMEVCQDKVINFTCSADGNPAVHTYQLFGNDVLVTNGSNSHGMWNKTMSTGGSFIYKCVANNTAGTGESESVNVTVNVPSGIQPIQDVNITEGENLALLCNVFGNPLPMVSWIKVGGDMSTSGSELVFTNISRTQAGEYMCEVSNLCGNASETVSIVVRFAPDNLLLETSAVNDKACRGDVISINCSADAVPPVTSYQLFENDIPISDTSGLWTKTFTTEGKFIYKCVANNSLGTGESASVTLAVNVASSIQPIDNQRVMEGGSVTLSCNATGFPLPMVSWIKVDGHMTVSNGSELAFTNINRSKAGEYRCEASNECGNASETATIEVQYKPENVQLKTSAVNSKACKGETISINCSADAVPPVTSYEILKNGSVILETSGMWSRTLSSGGVFIYKCVANNSLGSTESETVTVTVNVPSMIYPIQNETITEGDSVTLWCNASGIPSPMVSWIKVGSHMSTDESDLVFTNIKRSEAGEYVCEANNECGNASQTARIFVQYMPEIIFISENQTLSKGNSVSLNCTADGYPTPSITWTKASDNSYVSFPLTITGKQNERLYRCTADNGIGSPVTEEVAIIVHFSASIESLKNKTNVQKGGNVTLYCNVSGTPTPRVSWTRVRTGEKWFSKTVVIIDVQVKDLGEYKCEAINPYGNDTKSMFIFFPGGLCEKKCSVRKSCRQFGQYVCLCEKGKTGENCEEEDPVKKTFIAGIEFNEEFKPEYEDLENPTTIDFINKVKDAVKKEFSGSGINDVIVTKLREGSVIADMQLAFDDEVGKSEADALMLEAINDGKIGEFRVRNLVIDGIIEDFSTPAPSEPAEINRDVIYGTVIGILALMLTVFIAYGILKNRQRQVDNRLDITAMVEREPQFNEGMDTAENDENANTTNHNAASQYMALVEVAQSLGGRGPDISPYSEINEYAPLHPGTRSWEVPRENVIIEKIIGKGAFGQVAQGKASQLHGREETITVAIKMLKDNATEKERNDLLSELEVMKKLKPHRHVIKLLGCVTESDPLLVIIEYVPYGDLLGYLRKSRGLNDTYFKDPDVKPQTSLTSQQLMRFSWQVADGMRYLSSRNIIHRDLAARNVLVGEQENCKVTDFGMARDLNQESIYEMKTKSRLPVKWTAHEALLFGRYTTKSDVWSFGIVLYEIFTIGGSPYTRIDARKMLDILNRGYRMPKPSHVDEALYKIMQDCWREDPDDRPTFENLRDELKEMENQHQRFINLQKYDKKLYENVEDLMF